MKYLISFLGTGPLEKNDNKRSYRKAKYKYQDIIEEHEFVSLFLSKQLSADKLILIGTHKSMWENLYNNLVPVEKQNETLINDLITEIDRKHDEKWNEEIYAELQNEIEKNSDLKLKIIIVKYGLNESEIADNIKKIITELRNEFFENKKHQNKVELYLDVTHSFRSLALIFLQVIQYFTQIYEDNIEFKGIYYGMLDVDRELEHAPIVNLSQVAEIGKWANAAYAFKNFGNGYLISELIKNSNQSESNIINEFSNTLNLNLIFHVKSKISQLNGILNKDYPALGQIFIPSVLKEFTENFKSTDKDSLFQLNLAKWQFEKKRFGLAVIILYEALITWICEQEKLPYSRDNRDKAKEIINKYKNIEQIIRQYKVNDIRNGVAHQLNKKIKIETAIKNIENALNEASKIIK